MPGLNKRAMIAAFCVAGFSSCKTTRPTVDLQSGLKAPGSAASSQKPSYMTVSDVTLPVGAEAYDTTQLTVSSGDDQDQVFPNYVLDSKVDIKAYNQYEIILRLYQGDKVLYSNEYCSDATARKFWAKAGRNSFTVPVCVKPEGS